MTVFGLGHSIFAKALKKTSQVKIFKKNIFLNLELEPRGVVTKWKFLARFWSSMTCLRHKKGVHQNCHLLTTHNQAMPATPLYPERNMHKIQEKSKNSKQQNFSFHHKHRSFIANMAAYSDLCTDFALAFCLPSNCATTSLKSKN